MTSSTARLIVGNWKMNGDASLIDALAERLTPADQGLQVVVCPPATLLHDAHRRFAPLGIEVGGQDCHRMRGGAYTGDISPDLLVQSGATWVIVGHSERRIALGETDRMVRDKAIAAKAAGLKPIVCVGDTAEQRDAGSAVEIVKEQVRAVLDEQQEGAWAIAYEPIWAIGSGRAAAREDIRLMHEAIREVLVAAAQRQVPILYGGSVAPENARQILLEPDVAGALVGGASLKAEQFQAIIKTATELAQRIEG